MGEFLIKQGADANIKDTEFNGTPAGRAEHGGHIKLKNYREQNAKRGDSGESQGA